MFESLCRPSILLKSPTQVFSFKYCETFKNTYLEEHLRTAASAPILAVLVISLFAAEKQCLLILAKRTTVGFIATNKQVIFSSTHNISVQFKQI